ncbi:MAG: hypothetical protein R3E96_07175 [Planctomycetota bacterium]
MVLMGLNAIIGFAWRGGVRGQLSPDAWNFWWVCVPIVVVCAPMGARFIRNKSRLFVAAILYASIGIQFVAGLIIIKQTTALLLYSAAVFATGLFLFNRMAAGGVRRLEWLASHPEGGSLLPIILVNDRLGVLIGRQRFVEDRRIGVVKASSAERPSEPAPKKSPLALSREVWRTNFNTRLSCHSRVRLFRPSVVITKRRGRSPMYHSRVPVWRSM